MLYLLLLVAATSSLACDPVTNLVTTSVRSSEIRVSWSTPTTAQLQCIKAYRICPTPESCTTVQGSSITEYSVTGLESCTQYNVSVVTLDETNATSASAVVITRTAPGPATILGYMRRDNETILVLWNYPQTAGRTCATQFQLSLCDDSGANCSNTNVPVNASGTHYSLYLPRNRSCHAYVLDLVALDSSQQMSDNLRVNGDPDSMYIPENLMAANITASSFDLEWTIPDAQASCQYLVLIEINSSVNSVSSGYNIIYDRGVTKHSQTGVTSCTAFDISVYFSRTAAYRATTKMYTLPEGDKIFNFTEVQGATSSSVLVAWNTLLQIDQCIALYTVCWTKPSAAAGNCQNATNDKNSHNITGLSANTKYEVSVFALLHSGLEYSNVTFEASTKSGVAGVFQNYLAGILSLGLTLSLLAVST